jgi:hypothetical protein
MGDSRVKSKVKMQSAKLQCKIQKWAGCWIGEFISHRRHRLTQILFWQQEIRRWLAWWSGRTLLQKQAFSIETHLPAGSLRNAPFMKPARVKLAERCDSNKYFGEQESSPFD